MINEEMSDCKR